MVTAVQCSTTRVCTTHKCQRLSLYCCNTTAIIELQYCSISMWLQLLESFHCALRSAFSSSISDAQYYQQGAPTAANQAVLALCTCANRCAFERYGEA
eukprot:14626-Heterococcus_DN1.PRE.5